MMKESQVTEPRSRLKTQASSLIGPDARWVVIHLAAFLVFREWLIDTPP